MTEVDRFARTFLAEAAELLDEIEEHILELERNPEDEDAVNRLFRAMHTIKGSGAMFGFEEMAAFTHHVETALDAVRDGRMKVTDQFIDLVLKSRDMIGTMLGAVDSGQKVDPVQKELLITGLDKLMPASVRASLIPREAASVPEPEKKERVYRVRFEPARDFFAQGMDPGFLVEDLAALGNAHIVLSSDDLPELAKLDPESCYLKWNVVLETECSIEEVKDVFLFVDDASLVEIEDITLDEDLDVPRLGEILVARKDADAKVVKAALDKQERVGDLLAKDGKVPKTKVDAALVEQEVLKKKKEVTAQKMLRVPADKLDKLVNLVGELVITQAQLASLGAADNKEGLEVAIEEVGRLTAELRDVALNVRMVPIGSTFTRFRRLVRDLSGELGKQINLVTIGADTEMDKTVIDRLGDPLVHLIRNSIDHGIESPERRELEEKDPQGTITLKAAYQGAKVVVSIEDDGAGLNKERIRKKAIERGLISQDAVLSDQELYQLVLQPGFSTAQSVTNVSGRGVGMDVVLREIESLRGSILISSTPGKGTAIKLSLPLTLAIIDGLLVRVAEDSYVVPISMVRECLEMGVDHQAFDETRNLIKVRGELVPLIRIRDVFNYGPLVDGVEETVVVEMGDGLVGLVVDRVVGDHQTVIKPLGRLYRNVKGVSGATIMGDGRVALILDVPALHDISTRQEARYQSVLEQRLQTSSQVVDRPN